MSKKEVAKLYSNIIIYLAIMLIVIVLLLIMFLRGRTRAQEVPVEGSLTGGGMDWDEEVTEGVAEEVSEVETGLGDVSGNGTEMKLPEEEPEAAPLTKDTRLRPAAVKQLVEKRPVRRQPVMELPVRKVDLVLVDEELLSRRAARAEAKILPKATARPAQKKMPDTRTGARPVTKAEARPATKTAPGPKDESLYFSELLRKMQKEGVGSTGLTSSSTDILTEMKRFWKQKKNR